MPTTTTRSTRPASTTSRTAGTTTTARSRTTTAAAAAASTSTSAPAKRTTKPAVKDAGDKLADDLERVLKVSEPVPQAQITARRTAATAKTTATTAPAKAGPSRKTTTAPARTAAKPTATKAAPSRSTSVARPAASSSRVAAVSTTPTTARPASRPAKPTAASTTPEESPARAPKGPPLPTRAQVEATLPWAQAGLDPIEKARGAMKAINATLRLLASATQAGYKHGSVFTVRVPAAGAGSGIEAQEAGEELTEAKVTEWVLICEIGVSVLREAEKAGVLGNKMGEVDKASMGVAVKTMGVGMYRRALEQLQRDRPTSFGVLKSLQPKKAIPKAGAGKKQDDIPDEWLQLLTLPARPVREMDESMRTITFQYLAVAWISLISLDMCRANICDIFPLPSDDETAPLHPLILARTLPTTTTSSLLVILYRRLYVRASRERDDWLRLRHLASITLTLSISTNPPTKTTPQDLWTNCQRTVESYIKSSKGKQSVYVSASQMVDDVMRAMQGALQRDDGTQNREKWISGKEFASLMDLWIELSRKLGDTAAIDRALSYMSVRSTDRQTVVTISTDTPDEPSSSTSGPSRRKAPSKKAASDVDGAIEDCYRFCGDFARAQDLFEKYRAKSDELSAAAVESSLKVTQLNDVADALTSLDASEEALEVLAKTARGLERLRRSCVKVLGQPESGPNLVSSCHHWLGCAIDLVEDLLQSALDLSKSGIDLVSSAIDTIMVLCRLPTASAQSARTLLDRAHRLCLLARSSCSISARADWLRVISSASYNAAAAQWKSTNCSAAIDLARQSCDLGKETLTIVKEDEAAAKLSFVKQLGEVMPKRFEMVAACALKLSDRKAGADAYIECFAWMPAETERCLSMDASTSSISHAFATCKEVCTFMQRLAQVVVFEPASLHGRTSPALDPLSRLSEDARGLVLEKIVDSLADGIYKPEVAEIALDIGEDLLGLYGASKPVRRTRVIVKLLGVICQTGLRAERFSPLVEEVETLSQDITEYFDDVALQRCLPEYLASAKLLKAIYAYHQPGSEHASVLGLGRDAIAAVRAIVIPTMPAVEAGPSTPARTAAKVAVTASTRTPRRAATTKTPSTSTAPARKTATGRTTTGAKAVANKAAASSTTESTKVKASKGPVPELEDSTGLSRMLEILAALFGMLGHVLAKVEALKVLRAILRLQDSERDVYILRSGELATEYVKLGKHSRARTIFTQAVKFVASKGDVSPHATVLLHLRYSGFLALQGDLVKAEEQFREAQEIESGNTTPTATSQLGKIVERVQLLERACLAHMAVAFIASARGDAHQAIERTSAAFRLRSRMAEVSCRLAPQAATAQASEAKKAEVDPFGAAKAGTGQDEAAKDLTTGGPAQAGYFTGKHLDGLQWTAAENLMDITAYLVALLLDRGSAKEVEYYLKMAMDVAGIVRSDGMKKRLGTKMAELEARMRLFDKSLERLGEIEKGPTEQTEANGDQTPPRQADHRDEDARVGKVDVDRIKGDIFAKQEMIAEAGEMLDSAMRGVWELNGLFEKGEAMMPSPRKLRESLSAIRESVTKARAGGGRNEDGGMEMVLPKALAQVLRQQAWLLRDAGLVEDSEEILEQIQQLTGGDLKPDDLFLSGRIGVHEAFEHFKSDLWMSSLTESTLAMPMGDPQQRVRDRQSTRKSIQMILQRAESAFVQALEKAERAGRVEDVRMSCLNLALLKTFQTSLGEGSASVTASAADILAAAPGITLQRELVEAIAAKLDGLETDEAIWPTLPHAETSSLSSPTTTPASKKPSRSKQANLHETPCRPGRVADAAMMRTPAVEIDSDQPLRAHWASLHAKYSKNVLLAPQDLSHLPPNWAVISINVTEDKTTMFISRHQANVESIVFSLPLDRQGKREGEAEDSLFTFEAASAQLKGIIEESNENARKAKSVDTKEGRTEWWEKRYELDKRMKALVETMEFCWLGAFKTILSPRVDLSEIALEGFRAKLERIFNGAIYAGDLKKATKVHLDDSLLRTFANLDSKCRDEEAEDLVYFILDVYQFYGVQVALAELDIDQIAVDVKTALAELEAAKGSDKPPADEHIFLALDKNISGFPWESIPILRGRGVARVPSLPLMLDQVELLRSLSPAMNGSANEANVFDGRFKIDPRKVFYILNSSGDLERTQTYFEPWLATMQDRGWKGIVGRSPTEMEMVEALTKHDLVLYFGHGGAEQYIRSYKLRHLQKCATVMLWGCSSGALKDQGDLDRSGTAYNYFMGGCPSLVANLWDVTDRDIDRLSEDVCKRLKLDANHVPSKNASLVSSAASTGAPPNGRAKSIGVNGTSDVNGTSGIGSLTSAMGSIRLDLDLPGEISNVQAVNRSRDECKLTYLTGAAPVVYGLPIYMR